MEPEADAAFRRVRWMHLGFMAIVLVYVELGILQRAFDVEPQLEDNNETLWALRVGLAFLSVAGQVGVRVIAGSSSTKAHERPGWVGQFDAATQKAFSNAILRMAVSEAIAIYGLLLLMLGGHFADLLLFCGLSLAAFAWHFPKRGRWDQEVADIRAHDG